MEGNFACSVSKANHNLTIFKVAYRGLVPLTIFSYRITIRPKHGKSVIEMEIQSQDIFPLLLFLIHQAGRFKKIHFNVKPIFFILPSGSVLRANSLGSEKIAEQSEQWHPS